MSDSGPSQNLLEESPAEQPGMQLETTKYIHRILALLNFILPLISRYTYWSTVRLLCV
mgnify:CR=1 FL=1